MAVTTESAAAWMRAFAQEIADHRQELVRLDTAIGDGDHGTNMDRGMRKAMEKLEATETGNPGAVLKTVAMALVSNVGGAAGPLYGTLFLQLATGMGANQEIDLPAYAAAWRGAVQGVQNRGKAQPGDKTMVDALLPAVDALEKAGDLGQGLQDAVTAAEEGMRATIPLVARKGRASYLGERSAGHQDPGATSTYYLFKSAAEALAN
jgi:dihydroxyacetone kinase-like protein